MLNSSIAYHKQTNGLAALALTEEDRQRMERAGCAPADIERIDSEESMEEAGEEEE